MGSPGTGSPGDGIAWAGPAAGPPVFLVPPGALAGPAVTLTGPEGHHAAAVRRLRAGERADVSDGAGTLAEGVVTGVSRDTVEIALRAVHQVPPPQPRLAVAQALPKGDRGELAVELMTEIGVDTVIPWAAARSVTRWQAERGEKALAKWRATAREAAKQSRRAWLPEVTGAGLRRRPGRAGGRRRPGHRAGSGRAGEAARAAAARAGDILLVVGPEGGISPASGTPCAPRARWRPGWAPPCCVPLPPARAAAAVLLSRTARW